MIEAKLCIIPTLMARNVQKDIKILKFMCISKQKQSLLNRLWIL